MLRAKVESIRKEMWKNVSMRQQKSIMVCFYASPLIINGFNEIFANLNDVHMVASHRASLLVQQCLAKYMKNTTNRVDWLSVASQ